MKLVCVLWFCFVVKSTYGRRIGNENERYLTESINLADFSSESNSTNELESILATWPDFQIRHIVSSDQGSAANWNVYFRQRMPKEYGNKSVNSFIVNSASSVADNFPEGVPQYNGGTASNLYWSSTKQRIFVLTLSGPPGQQSPKYNVYDCGQRYFVAGLDMEKRLPVHYQGQSTTQGPRIDPITAGCTAVSSGNFFCQVDENMNGKRTNCVSVIVSGTLLGLLVVAFLIFAVFYNQCRRRVNRTTANEYSPLIGNDGDGRYVQ